MIDMNIASFFTPFTNRVHLVTLIMCIILFCALRMSGGAVRVQTSTGSESSTKPTVPESQTTSPARKAESNSALVIPDIEGPLNPKNELQQLGIGEQMKGGAAHVNREGLAPQKSDSDSLEDALLAKKANANPNKAAKTESGSSKDGLDDIEKRLGLK
jgi:hypothetical protein